MAVEDPYESSAQWLQEVARRRRGAPHEAPAPDPSAPAPGPSAPEPEAPRREPLLPHARGLLLFGVLAASTLQFHYLDVMLQIYALPSVTVFAAERPPVKRIA
jgi:hypothetical protein